MKQTFLFHARARTNQRKSLSLSNTDTEISVCPHCPAVASNTRVPLYKVSQADFVVAGKLTAHDALGGIVKLFAIQSHARLCGLRCLNAVGRARGSSSRRCRRRRCTSSDDANAHIDIGPHAGAIVVDGGVPFDEIFAGDFLVADHLAAYYTLVDEVELVAVCDLVVGQISTCLA